MRKRVGELRVHLDHHIRRQSIRYIPKKNDLNWRNPILEGERDKLRYDDIRRDEWFNLVRKPDFQRETNAWTPEDCVEFLDSVVNGRIVPSIILWLNQENSFIYALDGSHRLSVIRAWMADDWGDRAGEYYKRRDTELINQAADKTRVLVKQKIGLFADFQRAWNKQQEISNEGKAPKQEMEAKEFAQAMFYGRVMGGLTLSVQWEKGNYESAEQSFLRINRSGQALDPWEATLIEYRRSSYARSIMCIANGGESGHYWPELLGEVDDSLAEIVNTFSDKSSRIYKRLFVPPFRLPIDSLTVPLMVAPAYFQKHKYLLEIIPLIVNREVANTEEKQIKLMEDDVAAPPETIVRNADRILSLLEDRLDHFISPTDSSKSMAVVPLFYWYNQKAHYARGLFYGFAYWMLSGSDKDIANRKLIFSANRDRFEYLLFHLKPEIATLQEKGGAGLHAAKRTSEFFQALLGLLQEKRNISADSEELRGEVLEILKERARITMRSRKTKSSRHYSRRDKSQINIRELFDTAIRCHICGGVVNLQYGGLQYDHTEDYAISKVTDPETGKPTHPFCNNNKKKIQAYRTGIEEILLPSLDTNMEKKETNAKQLDFFDAFLDSTNFPG